MPKRVEFFFDYGSTYSYLAWAALPEFRRSTGAEILLRPMLLGGLFKLAGNHPPVDVALKGKYLFRDMQRCAAHAGIPFKANSRFPIMTLPLMRGAMVALEEGYLQNYSDALFTAMWCDDANLGDPAVVTQVLGAAGIDAKHVMDRTAEPAIKDALKANTEEAFARGAFGAPTFFVGEEMFWGYDRMGFVAEALEAATA